MTEVVIAYKRRFLIKKIEIEFMHQKIALHRNVGCMVLHVLECLQLCYLFTVVSGQSILVHVSIIMSDNTRVISVHSNFEFYENIRFKFLS